MRLMAASRVSEVAVREPELDGVQGAGGGRSCGDARESILVQVRRLSGIEQDADGDRLSGVCHGDVVIWVRWVRGRGSREVRPKQKLGRWIISRGQQNCVGLGRACQPVLNY
jgi:hypothetical protein